MIKILKGYQNGIIISEERVGFRELVSLIKRVYPFSGVSSYPCEWVPGEVVTYKLSLGDESKRKYWEKAIVAAGVSQLGGV